MFLRIERAQILFENMLTCIEETEEIAGFIVALKAAKLKTTLKEIFRFYLSHFISLS
jgi:hypothetical protein